MEKFIPGKMSPEKSGPAKKKPSPEQVARDLVEDFLGNLKDQTIISISSLGGTDAATVQKEWDDAIARHCPPIRVQPFWVITTQQEQQLGAMINGDLLVANTFQGIVFEHLTTHRQVFLDDKEFEELKQRAEVEVRGERDRTVNSLADHIAQGCSAGCIIPAEDVDLDLLETLWRGAKLNPLFPKDGFPPWAATKQLRQEIQNWAHGERLKVKIFELLREKDTVYLSRTEVYDLSQQTIMEVKAEEREKQVRLASQIQDLLGRPGNNYQDGLLTAAFLRDFEKGEIDISKFRRLQALCSVDKEFLVASYEQWRAALVRSLDAVLDGDNLETRILFCPKAGSK